MNADLLTIHEAAALVGMAIPTFRNHIRKGSIKRADGESGTRRALYCRDEVLALRVKIDAWKADRAEANRIDDGLKRCGRCRERKEFSHFAPDTRQKCGYAPHCKACRHDLYASHYRRNWDEIRTRHEEYKQANPEKGREYRKRKYARQPEREKAAHQEWVEKNRDHVNALRKQDVAIQDGLGSPITRKAGFVVMACADGSWRAARIDVPFPKGERATVRFDPPLSPNGRWIIRLWPVVDGSIKREAELLHVRYKRRIERGALKP